MTTAYSTLMGLAEPVQGELSGTWGDTVNKGITEYLDVALAGTQTISGTQTAVTLSLTNGNASATNIAQAGSGATGSAQFAIINCTGAPASLLTITVPASSRQYIVINATSTSQSVKIVGVGPTTGVTIVSGEKAHIAWNGSDFVKVASTVITNLTGTLAIANGGTGQTTASAAFNALSPITTTGDLIIGNGSNSATRLAIGTNGYVLTSDGTTATWAASTGGVTSFSAGTTGLTPSTGTTGAITLAGTLGAANGGTGLTSLTAGYIPFGNGTSAFGSSANLFWDSANNRFGIGTSSPQYTFHLVGTSLTTSKAYIESTSATGSGQPTFTFYRSSTTSMGAQFIGAINFIRALTDGSTNQAASISTTGSNSSSSPTGTLTYNPITGHKFQIASTTKMEMDVNGLLGVGVTPVANNGVLQLGSYGSVQALMEKATVSATAATGTINFDAATQPVLYYTTNSSGNWTINIRGSSTLTLDSMMQTGQSLTLAFLATNGATAYYQSALTVDGSSVTPKWQGGTAPTAGNASSIDAYVLTVIKTGSATFTVLASQTKFA